MVKAEPEDYLQREISRCSGPCWSSFIGPHSEWNLSGPPLTSDPVNSLRANSSSVTHGHHVESGLLCTRDYGPVVWPQGAGGMS
jgi:hypothetical protein